LRVRNLTCKSDTDDYYNPIDLNNIFNDDDILDEWIREGEQSMLPPDDLGWLDEGIRRSDESGGDGDDDGDGGDDDGGDGGGDGGDGDDSGYRSDGGNNEETHGVGGSQRVVLWHRIQNIMPHKIQIMEPGRGFRNNVGIWIGWSISVLAMIIRVDMITSHMVIIVLKAIYRDWV